MADSSSFSSGKGSAAAAGSHGIGILEFEATPQQIFGKVDSEALEQGHAQGIHRHPEIPKVEGVIVGVGLGLKVHHIGEARAAAGLDPQAQDGLGSLFLVLAAQAL